MCAYRKASRGKRGRQPTATFEFQLTDQLSALQAELAAQVYRPGPYTHFTIQEPKQRKISAAPFRDRVVHHALCNFMEPLFDRRFIFDSYANRIGKGTHAAIERLQCFSRHYRYVLRLDIVKHFPSLDHAVLTEALFRVVRDGRTRALIELILNSGDGVLADEYAMVYFPGDDLFAVERARGLPIGNLTSQFWSNCYMDPFDHFVKRELRCHGYVRYVDDFALFSDDKQQLHRWRETIRQRLATMRLTLHEQEAQVAFTRDGIPWLGWVVYPTHKRLKRRNLVHFARRFERSLDLYEKGDITFADLDATVQGWIEHVAFGDTWGLRRHLFDSHPIQARGRSQEEDSSLRKQNEISRMSFR